jgi:hypothetical protein
MNVTRARSSGCSSTFLVMLILRPGDELRWIWICITTGVRAFGRSSTYEEHHCQNGSNHEGLLWGRHLPALVRLRNHTGLSSDITQTGNSGDGSKVLRWRSVKGNNIKLKRVPKLTAFGAPRRQKAGIAQKVTLETRSGNMTSTLTLN